MSPLFVPLSKPVMAAGTHPRPARGWTIDRAEELLNSLTAIVSARVVAQPDGEIQEIHVLTTDEVSPKQTVRNVESALLAYLDLSVDHRKISVAQTKDTPPGQEARNLLEALPARAKEERILFLEHHAETERPHRVRFRVAVEWKGERFEGEASGTELPRTRLEVIANATLQAVETAVSAEGEGGFFTLALDGVKVVDAFDRQHVLVGVHAMTRRDVKRLAGSAGVTDSPDRAVILATLQATDRWVRGRTR